MNQWFNLIMLLVWWPTHQTTTTTYCCFSMLFILFSCVFSFHRDVETYELETAAVTSRASSWFSSPYQRYCSYFPFSSFCSTILICVRCLPMSNMSKRKWIYYIFSCVPFSGFVLWNPKSWVRYPFCSE